MHFGLDAHLARLEAQIAIGRPMQRFRTLELEQAAPIWGESRFRIQASQPLRFTL